MTKNDPVSKNALPRNLQLFYNEKQTETIIYEFDLQSINDDLLTTLRSKYGHCVFANTKKYIKCGGENENFIGYGPEDREREHRFTTLKYNVSRIDNLVYHFEHSRTSFSNGENKYYNPNHELCDKLIAMNYNKLLDYYSNIEYRKKYNKFD
jgi:predicted glycosyltransferase involved in capsule biosynthesis